jgi:HEAT repeat protein
MMARFAGVEPLVVGLFLLRLGIVLTAVMMAAVVVERVAYAIQLFRDRRIENRYLALIHRAVGGDETARRELAACPSRHRLAIAWLLITPLILDRDPARIVGTRETAQAMSLFETVRRYLRSNLWWRRAVALRAVGLMQDRKYTSWVVAALDDPSPPVRAAALDALTDLQDPASLPATVVRLHDASLHRGRRAAALLAFGPLCEPFLLELANVDAAHRLNYARALAICGTARARQALCQWTGDSRADVSAAAFEALAHVGLDNQAAALAIEGLQNANPSVRAMAARALRGWTDPGDAAHLLAGHLDDEWTVAVQAARTLESMGERGIVELRASSGRGDLAGTLARQMLWEARARC